MYHSTDHNVLVYDVQDDKIERTVPGSVRVHSGHVACPINLYNLQLLKYLGYPVIPPMEGNYDWPGRYTPFEAQRRTSNFLALHPRAFCLSDMGTGKTLAALWAADYIMGQYQVGAERRDLHNPGRTDSRLPVANPCKALIVAPLSTLQRVWADAIFTNLMGRRQGVVVYGDAAKRRKLLAKNADFYILNFDGIHTLRNELAARPDIRMVIVDEASAYRDRTTKRHKLARSVLMPRDYFWMMTGTPTPNGPTDAYGLAKLVNNANGESYVSYRDRTMHKISMWKWVPKTGSHAAARALMSPAIRFAIEDCTDLPPITTQTRDVELSSEQRSAYAELKRQLVLTMKSGQVISAANEAVLRGKLIQIACGAVYGPVATSTQNSIRAPARSINQLDCAPRLSALREVIEQCNEKIIIFAPLTSVLHLLKNDLAKDYEVRIVNGEVSQKERNEIFRAFQQDDDPRIIIADPGTMAHGLDLYAATTVVWFAPIDRTELYLQANKRIHRPGQTKTCTIVHLAATAIEREIFRRLAANESLMGVLLTMIRGGE